MATQGLLPFQRMCRACLTDQKEVPAAVAKYWQNMNDLRQPSASETEKVRIAALLKNCVPQLLVKELEELPQLICPLCLAELENMHKFQQKCLTSERRMHERLEQERKKETPSKSKKIRKTRASVDYMDTEDPLQHDEASVEEIGTWLKFETASEELEENPETFLSAIEERSNQQGMHISKENEAKSSFIYVASKDNIQMAGSSASQIMSKFKQFETVLTRVTEEVFTLRKEVEQLKTEISRRVQETVESSILNIPVKERHDFEEFNELLTSNPVSALHYKKFLQNFSVVDGNSFVRRSLKETMCDEVAVQYSWSGTAEKPCVKFFKCISIIKDVFTMKFPETDSKVLEITIQKHLQHAKDRIAKRSHQRSLNDS